LGRFFFALVALTRFAVSISFLERPLVIAFVVSLFWGNWFLLLPPAIFYELFWLDIIPVGSIIPPSASFAFLLLLPLMHVFCLHTPELLALPLLATLCCAYALRHLEGRRRLRADAVAGRVECALASHDPDIDGLLGRCIRASLFAQAVQGMVLYGLCYGVLLMSLHACVAIRGALPELPGVDWPVLLCAAALGGLLALRTRQAFWLFCVAACAAIVLR